MITRLNQILSNGWTRANETWTYASASTFTIAGVDRTAVYTKGTRLKFTQSGSVKYAVVIASAFSTNTTVTIAVNTDYTIANAAISENYFSYEVNPQGYPHSFAYTPSWTNLTIGDATVTARYSVIGNTVSGRIGVVLGASSSVSSDVKVSLPVTATSTAYGSSYPIGMARFNDTGTAAYLGRVEWESTTTAQILIYKTDGTYETAAAVTATTPHTWASTDEIYLNFSYEF